MNTFCSHFSVLSLLSLLTIYPAVATEKPLWEIGVGAGGLTQSYYTGTTQQRSVVFPVFSSVYLGSIVKSDDRGLRAQLFKNPNYKLDMSADFHLAVDSDDVDLREGMNDIDNIVEIGPSLQVTLDQDENGNGWFANFPLKAAIAIDAGDLKESGYNFAPNIMYRRFFSMGDMPWRFNGLLAAKYGSDGYNDIYYGVAPKFAVPTRSAYVSDSGYAGARLQLSLASKKNKHLWVLFVRYDNITGAVFDDSPLVETDNNVTLGILYSRYLLQSKTMVNRHYLH